MDNKEKQVYTEPIVEIIEFETEDVITTSGNYDTPIVRFGNW